MNFTDQQLKYCWAFAILANLPIDAVPDIVLAVEARQREGVAATDATVWQAASDEAFSRVVDRAFTQEVRPLWQPTFH